MYIQVLLHTHTYKSWDVGVIWDATWLSAILGFMTTTLHFILGTLMPISYCNTLMKSNRCDLLRGGRRSNFIFLLFYLLINIFMRFCFIHWMRDRFNIRGHLLANAYT